MEQNQNTDEIGMVNDFVLLLCIAAELHEPLNAYQYGLTKGICLIAEEPDEIDSLLLNLSQLEDVEILHSARALKLNLPNYKLGVYAAQKYDKAEEIYKFLTLPGFLTAVVVGGSVPDNIPDCYKVLLPAGSFSYSNARNLDGEISDVKDFLRSHPTHMEDELELFESSSGFIAYENKTPLYVPLLFAAKMYCLWHRSFHAESETETRYCSLIESLNSILKLTEESLDTIELSEIVIQLFINYTENHNEICFATPDKMDEAAFRQLENGNLILFDDTYYYVYEALMKTICSPLLKSFGWLSIKEDLRSSGILYCNFCQSKNYTRKKALPNRFGYDSRPRFLWLQKKYFVFPDNLAPEERSQKSHAHLPGNTRSEYLPDIQ